MRIVSGEFRSRQLKTLRGDNTRPTSDKIRGAIFDSIAFEHNLNSMLDLFSGSGAMGIEAISRGFDYAILNDNSRDAIKIIKENVKSLDVNKKVKLLNYDYKKCLLSLKDQQIDFIFIDPPYDQFDVDEILEIISLNNILSNHGIVVVEGSNKLTTLNAVHDLRLYKEKDYKSTVLKYYRKGD